MVTARSVFLLMYVFHVPRAPAVSRAVCTHVFCVCACDESSSPRIWHSFQTAVQGKKTPGTVREIKPQSEAVRAAMDSSHEKDFGLPHCSFQGCLVKSELE